MIPAGRGRRERNRQSARPLLVPRHIVDETYRMFAAYRSARVESIGYWYGIESDTADAVVSLAVPDAERGPCHYAVSEDTITAMGRAMMGDSLVCLAQFHTHPGQSTAHSAHDVREAMSNRDRFLSLVAPWHGSPEHAFPDCVSAYERQGGRWVLLEGGAKRDRIRTVDGVVDLRGGS